MNIDMTTITDEAAAKVWDELNAGEAAPFEEQNAMIQYSVKAKVLPVINVVVPFVQKAAQDALKEKMIATINESYDAGHDAEFTLMALTAMLSEDD